MNYKIMFQKYRNVIPPDQIRSFYKWKDCTAYYTITSVQRSRKIKASQYKQFNNKLLSIILNTYNSIHQIFIISMISPREAKGILKRSLSNSIFRVWSFFSSSLIFVYSLFQVRVADSQSVSQSRCKVWPTQFNLIIIQKIV